MKVMLPRLPYREIWVVDFEFIAEPGEQPNPICLVARELLSGQLLRLWRDQLTERPPYSVGANSLFVAYYASAEIGCHLKLNWPVPLRVLDLYTEFRNRTNNIPNEPDSGLIDALKWFGLDAMEAAHKDTMRELVLRGGPRSRQEQQNILDYCQADVDSTVRLLERMAPEIELAFALIRGRYMSAVARMEHQGIPIDCDFLEQLRTHWERIKRELVARVNPHFGVYDEELSFRTERFLDYLARRQIHWPRLGSGAPDLTDETFKRMAEVLPELRPLRELRKTLSQVHPDKLQVGRDGYNRCLLSPFRSKTGRNQPSNSKYIFGQASWVRHLIKPPPGYGVVYLDFEQQEFGIAAALSQDPNMMAAYRSGDSYLAFAKQAGAVPQSATNKSHEAIRNLYKTGALAIQYGISNSSLAVALGQPLSIAQQLSERHHRLYRQFWNWSANVIDHARLRHFIETRLGWRQWVDCKTNPRSLLNFPMQSNGAEMLRLYICAATEQGFWIGGPVHDAVLLVAPLDLLSTHTAQNNILMQGASGWLLDGFQLRSEAKIFEYPNRFIPDMRGIPMWNLVNSLLANLTQ